MKGTTGICQYSIVLSSFTAAVRLHRIVIETAIIIVVVLSITYRLVAEHYCEASMLLWKYVP